LSASTVGRVIARHRLYFADTPSHKEKRRGVRAALVACAAVLLVLVTGFAPGVVDAQSPSGFESYTVRENNFYAESAHYRMAVNNTWGVVPVTSTSYKITNGPAAADDDVGGTSGGTTGGTSGGASGGTNGGATGGTSGGGNGMPPPGGATGGTTGGTVTTGGTGTSGGTGGTHGAPASSRPTRRPPGQASSAPAVIPASSSAGMVQPLPPLIVVPGAPVMTEAVPGDVPPTVADGPNQTPAPVVVLHAAAAPRDLLLLLIIIVLATWMLWVMGSTALRTAPARRSPKRRAARRKHTGVHVLILLILVSVAGARVADAASTGPQKHLYTGYLLDNDDHPLTSAHSIRFSYWNS
jgi:hypothetical protein